MNASAALPPANENLSLVPQPRAYRCRVIGSLSEFQPLQRKWDAFLQTAGIYNLSMTHGFLYRWLEHFPPEELLILIVEDANGHWMGVAPLQINRGRRGLSHRALRQVQWVGTDPTVFDWMTVAIHPNATESAVISALSEQIRAARWDILDLDFGLEEPRLRQLCDALGLQSAETALWQSSSMPYIALPDNPEDYEKTRRKKTRLEINRLCNMLQRSFDEPWRIEYKNLTPESERLIDRFIEIHIQYWAERGSSSDFKRYPRLSGFYKALLADAPTLQDDHAPRLLFNVLAVGDTVLSYHLDAWQGNSYLTHITSYDEQYKQYSPGKLHMDRLVFDALGCEAEEFSFGRGDEPYKAMWTKEKKPLWRLQLFRYPFARLIWNVDPFLKKVFWKGRA